MKSKSKIIFIVTLIIGFIGYFIGFTTFSKVSILLMTFSGLLIMIPILIMGINLRTKNRALSIVMIVLSVFFMVVIITITIGTILTYNNT